MRGAFYSRSELAEPWALRMPAVPDAVTFHLLATGRCTVSAAGEGVVLEPGDLVLVPHGRGHELAADAALLPAPHAPRVDLLPQDFVGEHYTDLRHGGSGATSLLLCGVIGFEAPAARRLLGALPPVVHVRTRVDAERSDLRDTVALLARELRAPLPGGEAVTTRLADVLVIQALRTWLADAGNTADVGWLGALRDPAIGAALAAVHRDPGGDWTLTRLADVARMSRTVFVARFRDLVGQTPAAYVMDWRMTLAQDRLLADDATIGRIASDLGYRSEAAFSRAFTRTVGRTPGVHRRAAHAIEATEDTGVTIPAPVP